MYIPDIIKKKRDGGQLSEEEIEYIIGRYVSGELPDYQMSALLMACFINGIETDETSYLTKSMMNSGDAYQFDDIEGIKADKHSTGGVGDKVSIPLAPVLAELGFYVPMVSGRGLGHTGGTLDKLESIEGFDVELDSNQFRDILKKNRVVMAGQTDQFVPADKKLYALRDVTGTVESIPLITASIMSKKLSEGIDSLVLDVKCGNGAFMKDFNSARELADSMFETGRQFSKKMLYIISDMSRVLGNTAGNGIEIDESVKILKNELKNDTYTIVKKLASMLLTANNLAPDNDKAGKMVDSVIEDGRAYERFEQMVNLQGGNVKKLSQGDLIYNRSIAVKAKCSGYIDSMDTYAIGVSLIHMNAGRNKKDDRIDHKTGIRVLKKTGDFVEKDDDIFIIHYRDNYEDTMKILTDAFTLSNEKPPEIQLIKSERTQ
ncbi:MAG: thymidine phosphorylase [candidate division WOR-3 bacterium]|nr:thymidine phosphorylase [candidate division WOR-3 bacterium]